MKKIIISVFFLIALVSCGPKQATRGVVSGVVKEFISPTLTSSYPTIKFVDGREFCLCSMPDNPVEKGRKIEIFYWKKAQDADNGNFYLHYDSIRVAK